MKLGKMEDKEGAAEISQELMPIWTKFYLQVLL
jgi:hypothetical protein